MPEILFKNVNKTFSNHSETVEVLKDISGTVAKGSILTLIGPSGSGKSTLLSLCNLMLAPDAGEIFVKSKEIRLWDIQELRRQVGIAFQSAPMLNGTVLENLTLPAKLQGQTLEHPEKHLDYVGLSEDLLSRTAKDLSGGQKQRLSLARTLINHSSILLLDEITSALDSISANEIEELILRINREHNITILWVTHDQAQAERVGDQTWLIMDGRLIEAAPSKQFFTAPQTAEAQEFLEMKRVFR